MSRGEDGGDAAGAAAEQEQRLAKKALAAITTTRRSLGLASLRCADGVDWEATLHACERLRGRAKRLRPVRLWIGRRAPSQRFASLLILSVCLSLPPVASCDFDR